MRRTYILTTRKDFDRVWYKSKKSKHLNDYSFHYETTFSLKDTGVRSRVFRRMHPASFEDSGQKSSSAATIKGLKRSIVRDRASRRNIAISVSEDLFRWTP